MSETALQAQEEVVVMDASVEATDTSHLHWFQQSKAKDAQYFTPEATAQAIFETVRPVIAKRNVAVLDPSAGTGRLLKPFKALSNVEVVGIEYDELIGKTLKRTIGKEQARIGHILDYYKYLKSEYDVIVTNPPFGLRWDISGRYFEIQDDDIESQSATLEIAYNALRRKGLVVAIIPTTTWQNAKDRKLVQYIHKQFHVLACLTVPDMFKTEYKIGVSVDVVFLAKYSSYSWSHDSGLEYSTVKATLSQSEIGTMPEIVRSCMSVPQWESIIDGKSSWGKQVMADDIPNLHRLTSYQDVDTGLYLTTKGVTGSGELISLLQFYDHVQLEHYNSVLGKPAGLYETYFSIPTIIRNGIQRTTAFCDRVGFPIEVKTADKVKFEKLRERWRYEATPLYQPKSHELLAYYLHKPYPAKATVQNEDGHLLYQKGTQYLIKPSWARKKEKAHEVSKADSKGKVYTETVEIESGCLQLEVESEQGIQTYVEIDTERIDEFLKAFELPNVKGVAELFPEHVEQWAHVVAKRFPVLFGYQMEDLPRLLTKKHIYIGYEMGGGKTLMAFAYATARQLQRVLIICQGSLVENWVNEAEKFGFTATALKNHKDIDAFLSRVKRQDFVKHQTEFFVIGQEFLSLDGGKVFYPWECVRKDKEGNVIHREIATAKACSKGHKYEVQVKQCPHCEANVYEGWSGKYCQACGYVAYTYGATATGEQGMNQYPAYKRIRKYFSGVITDESQNFANRSLRGEATRAIPAQTRVMLTGTLMRNYVSDVFLNIGWLMGYANPVFYFNRGDVKRFMDEFGSYEYVTKEYLEEYKDASSRKRKGGHKKLLPAVSNLNRFWRLISPFTVRRLSEEVKELKSIERERHIKILPMESSHARLYGEYECWAKTVIDKEMRKREEQSVNMGAISRALWKLRFAAAVPNSPKLDDDSIVDSEYPGRKLNSPRWNKIAEMESILAEAKANGEKVIVFSGLKTLQTFTRDHLTSLGYRVKFIDAATDTGKRFAEIQDFSTNGYNVLVTGSNVLNRGYTITAANHVIFLDLAYTPEITDQAEFRCIRPGQEKKVHIYYLLSQGTIDEDMLNVNNQKREAIQQAINKKAKYAGLAELLKQRDTRNPELAVAKRIQEKRVALQIKELPFVAASVKPLPEPRKPIPSPVNRISSPRVSVVVGDQMGLF